MIFTRLLSLLLRLAQFAFAAIVLGLAAWFLHQRTHHNTGPYARLIYTVVWSSLSVLASVVGVIPTKASIVSYGSDLLFTAGWTAVFGVLVDYFNGTACGSAWDWTGFSFRRDNACGQWKAAQAFAFLSLVVWFAAFVLGVITCHRLKTQTVVGEGPGKSFWGRRARV